MKQTWSILCPGKSLERPFYYSNQSIKIAVNHAVLKGIRCDYWAMLDPEVFKTCIDRLNEDEIAALQDHTVIWTHWNFPNCGGTQLAGWTEKHRNAYRGFVSMVYDELPDHVWLGDSRLWKSFTVFTAMALSVYEGGDCIELFGCDMGGSGYFREGLENSRTRHDLKRWQEESELFAQVKIACVTQGIRVFRRPYDL